MKYIILGTAGHIDHGKSSLVKALTGIDPDRLKEEKERGITLDLGFASLDLQSGTRLGIVDVPGHEGLIKNMLAGVGGIDIVMLVIAADEGIMPQTREHLAICDLLHIKKGLIALTKIDTVEKDWLELVKDEISGFVKGTFLEKAPIVPVSSKTGENLPLLVDELDRLSKEAEPKSPNGILRLPIDRVFTMKGFGTIITGTLLSGAISQDQEVEILPKGIKTRVRGLQSHNRPVQRGVAGQRVAVNLQGVEKQELSRGDTIVSKGFLSPTRTLDASLILLPQATRTIKTGTRIRFYNTTQEAVGRAILLGADELSPSGKGFVQFRLESPVIVQHGDRFIIRFYSPLETLGGGMVIDPHPRRHKRSRIEESLKRLSILESGNIDERLSIFISSRGIAGIEENEITGYAAADRKEIVDSLSNLVQKKTVLRVDTLYIHASHLLDLEKRILTLLSEFHKNNPLKPGVDKEELRGMLKMRIEPKVLNTAVEGLVKSRRLETEGSRLRLPGFKAAIDQGAIKEKIINAIRKGGSQPPLREELPEILGITDKEAKDLMRLIAEEGSLVRINDSLFLDKAIVERMRIGLINHLNQKKEITVAEFRDIAKTSRKYAVPILEYFDTQKITQRVGDKRVLRG